MGLEASKYGFTCWRIFSSPLKMAQSTLIQWITCLGLLLWAGVEAQWVVPAPLPTSNVNQEILETLLGYMDNRADPCQDFQKYVGGNYEEKHSADIYSEIQGEIEQKVNDRFLSTIQKLNDSVLIDENGVEAKVLRFYQTCRTAKPETRSEKHYLELVPPDAGLTWPQFASSPSAWPKAKFQWMTTLARLRRYGFDNLLIKVNVKLDFVDSSRYMVTIDKPTFDSSSERLKGLVATKKLLIKLGVSRTRAMSLARNIRKLESEVRQLAEVEDEPNDDLTLRELESQNGFPWRQYLQIVFGRTFPASFEVQIMNVDYFVELKKVLRKYDAEIVASYMMVRFAKFMEFTSESDDENDALECLKDVRVHMNLGTNFLYESQYFAPEQLIRIETDIQQIFNALRTQLLAKIEANRLKLTPGERTVVKLKLQATKLNVGNMPKNQDHRSFVTNFYRDLQLPIGQDYAAAQLKVLEVRTRRILELLDRPAAKGNAYYFQEDSIPEIHSEPTFLPRENTIVLPYDILQKPFYDLESHDVFKVSLLGWVIAQQLMESLELPDLIYDAVGNPSDKFTNFYENRNYVQALSCLKSNATDYVEQRAGDVTALKLIYEAYFGVGSKYSQVQPSFTRIPLQQLFFLNMAQNLIGDEEFVTFSNQESDKVRLHHSVANLPAFGQAFNCPLPSVLNPYVKCDVW